MEHKWVKVTLKESGTVELIHALMEALAGSSRKLVETEMKSRQRGKCVFSHMFPLNKTFFFLD